MKSARYYLCVIEKDPDSAYGVWFPDMPGAYGAADDFEDVIREAGTVLRLHVEALEASGKSVPAPRSYEQVVGSQEVRKAIAAGATAAVVPLLADGGRSVRINLSMERGLVDQIDAAAKARGLTRSSFLAQAAREKILDGIA